MTTDDIKAMNYTEMTSPVKGQMFIKQNGTVLYITNEDILQLPNGRQIKNPTEQDMRQEYSEFVSFPKISGCTNCIK